MTIAKNKKADGLIATTFADSRNINVMNKMARNRIFGAGGMFFLKIVGPLLDSIRLPMKWVAPIELISNDSEISRVFMKDRLAGGGITTIGFIRSLMNAKPALEPEDFDVCPVLLVHPGIVPWTPLEFSKQFFDRIKYKKELVSTGRLRSLSSRGTWKTTA